MSTSTILVTVKLLLTLVVLVAQVSAPLPIRVPSQVRPILDESACDQVIADFREEVERHNAVAFIRRENGQDVVDIDSERYTKRILMIVGSYKVGAYSNRFVHVTRNEYVQKFHALFVEFKLIPPLRNIESSLRDIAKMNKVDRFSIISIIKPMTSVLFNYIISIFSHNIGDAIESFYDESEQNFKRKNELATFIVPFAQNILAYDEAIDYITRQYQEHCLSPAGIVQQNKLHYLKLWWSSVNRITPDSQDEMPEWEAFMSTACPLPKEEILLLFDPKDTPLDLVDFEQEVAVPERVKVLWSHLPMIEESVKNSEMISKLVESFNSYKESNEYLKKKHDEDLWIGYQKKFIVLQTIVRVMLKEPSDSQNGVPSVSQVTVGPILFKSPLKWVSKYPAYSLKFAGKAVAIGLFGYKIIELALKKIFTPDSTTPFLNISSPPPLVTNDRIPLPIEPVWLIVGVMIIVAIVLVGTVLCLVCRAKRKRNDGDKDKTSKTAKSKTKKDLRGSITTKSAIKRSPVSSTPTCLLIGTTKDTTGRTPSSTRPTSSSLGHQRSSPYTTSAFTTSAIEEAQGHRPVLSPKSPVSKPTFSISTPRKALSKSPLFIGSSKLWSSTPGPDIVNSSASSQLSSPSSALPGSNPQAPKVALPTKANSPNVKSPPGKAQTGKGNTTTTKPGDPKGAKKRDPKK